MRRLLIVGMAAFLVLGPAVALGEGAAEPTTEQALLRLVESLDRLSRSLEELRWALSWGAPEPLQSRMDDLTWAIRDLNARLDTLIQAINRLAAQRQAVEGEPLRLVRPPELLRRPPEATGLVKEIRGNLILIEVPGPGGGAIYSGPEGVRKEGEWRELQVVVTRETRIYRRLPPAPGEQQGREIRERAEEIPLADIEPGDWIEVWGELTDAQIVAQVIYIRRSFAGGP